MSAPDAPSLPEAPFAAAAAVAVQQPDDAQQYDQTNMAAAEAAAAFPVPGAEDPIQQMLNEKDAEIEELKQTILHQSKEIKSLKRQVKNAADTKQEDLKAASIEGIANDAISPAATAKPGSKTEARWKNRFQQVVAFKLEVSRLVGLYCGEFPY